MTAQERVLSLERQLAGVQSQLDVTLARSALVGNDDAFRIAVISGDPEDDDNTFDVIFQDGTYLPSAGDQSPTYQDRQIAARTVVHNLAGEKIPEGKRTVCFWNHDRWWSWWTAGSPGESPPETDQVTGLDGVFARSDANNLAKMSELEDRPVEFLPPGDELWGSAAALIWDEDENYFTVPPSVLLVNITIHSQAPGNVGVGGSQVEKLLSSDLNTVYVKMEERPAPFDAGDAWEEVEPSRCSVYGATGGLSSYNTHEFFYQPTANMLVRLVTGADRGRPIYNEFAESFYLDWSFFRLNFQ